MLDFDRDGSTDLLTSSVEFPTFRLYHNRIGELTPANFLAVRLVGGSRESEPSTGWSNRDGVGAKIRLRHADGSVQIKERSLGEGLGAQNSPTLLFGLGAREQVNSLTVSWPSGRETQLDNLAAGTLLTIYENPAEAPDGTSFAAIPYAADPQVAVASTYPSQPTLPAPLESDARLTLYVSMATWCAACTSKLPLIEQIRQQFTAEELEIVAIPIDDTDTTEKLQSYQTKYQPSYRLLIDRTAEQVGWMQGVIGRVLEEEALPSSVLVDFSGRVLVVDWGLPSVSEIRRQLQQPAPHHQVWRTLELPPPASANQLEELLEDLTRKGP